ncbi:MAG: DnaJ domain-containing protein [Nitrosotalea sp.]
MNRHHCYALLGLCEGASTQEIKSAYRKLVLKHHPDKSISKQDDEKFKLITEAYQVLRTNHKNAENLNYKTFDATDSDEGFGSKIPYWNELNPEKIFKEEWNRYARYAEMTYKDICKYEQDLWKYSEKLTKYTMSMIFPSIVMSYRRVPFFLTSHIYDPLLKKKKQQNFKSKLKSSLSYVGPRKSFKIVKRIYTNERCKASVR